MHLSMICVEPGDEIDEGMTIGLLGGSGYGKELAYSAHLHYEIHKNGQAIDPWDAANNQPHDPQKWISSSGPHLNSSAYTSGGSGFDLLQSMQGITGAGSYHGSSNSSTSSSQNRTPVFLVELQE